MGNCIQAAFSGGGGGATVSTQIISPTDQQTTTATSLADVSDGSATLANVTDGKAVFTWNLCSENTSAGAAVSAGFYYNDADKNVVQDEPPAANVVYTTSVTDTDDTDGGTLQLRWKVQAGTTTLVNDYAKSLCTIFEVG